MLKRDYYIEVDGDYDTIETGADVMEALNANFRVDNLTVVEVGRDKTEDGDEYTEYEVRCNDEDECEHCVEEPHFVEVYDKIPSFVKSEFPKLTDEFYEVEEDEDE
jgi:hypothetical protein